MSPKTSHKNLRNFVSAAVILLLIMLLITSILQCSLAAEIKGNVIGANGENLNGAEVKIYDSAGSMQQVATVNGKYAINLTSGNYLVVVTYIDSKENLYLDTINLTVEENETKTLDFSLITAYTNFSDIDIPALEGIFKIENLTNDSSSNFVKSNGTSGTNNPQNTLNYTHQDWLLFLAIFASGIILVFFYILRVQHNVEKTEEKIDKVETGIKKTEEKEAEEKEAEEKEAEEKSRVTMITSATLPTPAPTTIPASQTTPDGNAPVSLSSAEDKKKEEYKAEAERKEKERDEMFKERTQKERENLLSSLTENERIVINLLMEHGGDLLRTEISRGTNLPKSSLSMALKKLEDKKIIELDKTFTIQKVKFTSWFKSLL